jgi:hypothetical protein
MSLRGKSTTTMVVAGIVAVVALVILVTSLSSCGSSPRSYVRDHYTAAGKRNGTEVFRSKDRVERVVKDITSEWKPADRLTDTGGVFLRYRDDLIAVRPRTAGGSEISVDDPDRGYAHWYPFVGGWFGTYSGRAEGFRGGGPGTGK